MREVGFLVYPSFQLQHASGPVAAFEHVGGYHPSGYRCTLLSPEGGLVASSAGIEVNTISFAESPALDTLFVAGGMGWIEASGSAPILSFLGEQAGRCSRIALVTVGAGIAAAAGLLAGRRVTTHWSRASELSALYPDIRFARSEPVVTDGPYWSAATSAGAIELARMMIARDFDEVTARRATADLLPRYRRSEGFASSAGGKDRFKELLAWARQNLDRPLTIDDLAERVSMHPRQFVPAFAAAIGSTPAKAIERLRVEAALAMIEGGDEPLARIAAATGFMNPERMRRAFVRALGQPPNALRQSPLRRHIPGGAR